MLAAANRAATSAAPDLPADDAHAVAIPPRRPGSHGRPGSGASGRAGRIEPTPAAATSNADRAPRSASNRLDRARHPRPVDRRRRRGGARGKRLRRPRTTPSRATSRSRTATRAPAARPSRRRRRARFPLASPGDAPRFSPSSPSIIVLISPPAAGDMSPIGARCANHAADPGGSESKSAMQPRSDTLPATLVTGSLRRARAREMAVHAARRAGTLVLVARGAERPGADAGRRSRGGRAGAVPAARPDRARRG